MDSLPVLLSTERYATCREIAAADRIRALRLRPFVVLSNHTSPPQRSARPSGLITDPALQKFCPIRGLVLSEFPPRIEPRPIADLSPGPRPLGKPCPIRGLSIHDAPPPRGRLFPDPRRSRQRRWMTPSGRAARRSQGLFQHGGSGGAAGRLVPLPAGERTCGAARGGPRGLWALDLQGLPLLRRLALAALP